MTVHLNLPQDLERQLLAEVSLGRHASLEEAILEKLSRCDDADLLALTDHDAAWLRRDLDNAWTDRQDVVDGESYFSRLAARSASLKAQGK